MNNEKETIIKGKKEGNISQFGGGEFNSSLVKTSTP